MNKRSVLSRTILIIGLAIAVIAAYQNYFYIYLLAANAPNYPTGKPADNMEIYQIDPETILTSLDQGKTDAFMIAQKNPIYDDVPALEPHSSFPWNQQESLTVANAFHQFIWNESLDKWHLYSAGFTIPQCKDISRINSVGFQFYQRQKNWHYLFHNVDINLEYGYIYASDNNGHYTGHWKDLDLDTVRVNSVDKALLIAERNGGQETRATVKDNEKCHISIYYSPFPLSDKSWLAWGWEVTYWIDSGNSLVYGIIIDPHTGRYRILNSK
jgi:hypothetical protein